ncbi:minichromosome maintenance- protein [Terramyces sp. JEL0728]|nr:minichromosome maintenance- protein [Terramyces sp. JEL0728]
MEQSPKPLEYNKDEIRMIAIKKQILDYQEQIAKLQHEYQAIKQKYKKKRTVEKLEPKEKKIQSFPLHAPKIDLDKVVQDRHSKLRLCDMPISTEELDERMYDRKYVQICDIENTMQDGDINEDWVTIGAVYEQSAPFQLDRGMQIQCLSITDLRANGSIRVFLKGSDCMQNDNLVGSVIAILNGEISKPTQNNGELALTLTSSLLLMGIGRAVDLGFCDGGAKEKCSQFLDRRAAKYCQAHQVAIYQQAKLKRQEFATGDRLFTIGTPVNKHEKKKSVRQHDKNASYQIGKHTVVAQGSSVQVFNPPKPTSERVLSEKEQSDM